MKVTYQYNLNEKLDIGISLLEGFAVVNFLMIKL